LTYFVRRTIAAASSPTGPTNVDCATAPDVCELTVQGTPSQPTTTVALAFDPNIAPVAPTITADPNTGLTDNQNVVVSLQGFTPDEPVQIVECSADALTEGNIFSYCDYTTAETITPTGPQLAQTAFVVRAALGGQGGLEDCTTQPGACVLIASEGNGYSGGVGVVIGPTQPDVASTALSFTTP